MNLEKHYYDETEQTRVEIEKKVEEQESSLTDSERNLRAEQYRNEIDLIYDKAIAQSKQKKKLISKRKVQRFYRLVKKADYLAARLEVNFTAHTDNGYKGVIRLSGPQMIIDDSWESGELRILAKLISDANDMWIDTIDHNGKTLVQMEFIYDFSEIE